MRKTIEILTCDCCHSERFMLTPVNIDNKDYEVCETCINNILIPAFQFLELVVGTNINYQVSDKTIIAKKP